MSEFLWRLVDENGDEVKITSVQMTSSWTIWSPDGEHWYEGAPPSGHVCIKSGVNE